MSCGCFMLRILFAAEHQSHYLEVAPRKYIYTQVDLFTYFDGFPELYPFRQSQGIVVILIGVNAVNFKLGHHFSIGFIVWKQARHCEFCLAVLPFFSPGSQKIHCYRLHVFSDSELQGKGRVGFTGDPAVLIAPTFRFLTLRLPSIALNLVFSHELCYQILVPKTRAGNPRNHARIPILHDCIRFACTIVVDIGLIRCIEGGIKLNRGILLK
mmetsp:Transcript_21186/g.43583  ORF Transcript_21186/g.43583 Transcript_21186/m.43583 type:complete len:212 (+) Transcript_21186:51-686(+)